MIGELISAAGSVIGGLFGKSSADKAADMNAQIARENMEKQEQFAKEGVRWRVADAKAAGLHPLYALGASVPSFSPVSANFTADTSMANAFSRAGQDIGRAVNSTRTSAERGGAFNEAVQKLSLEKMGLENEVLRADLASKVARVASPTQAGPAFPGSPYIGGLEGQGQATVGAPAAIKEGPLERTGMNPVMPHAEVGAVPGVGWEISPNGGYIPVPSKDIKDRIEDSPHEWRHLFMNNILPLFQRPEELRPPFPAPLGKMWSYSFQDGYRLVPSKFAERFHYYPLQEGSRGGRR